MSYYMPSKLEHLPLVQSIITIFEESGVGITGAVDPNLVAHLIHLLDPDFPETAVCTLIKTWLKTASPANYGTFFGWLFDDSRDEGQVQEVPVNCPDFNTPQALLSSNDATVASQKPTSAISPNTILSPLRAGSCVMGRYRILGEEPLGEGGWCVVWKAQHEVSGREVAVKTFHDQSMREAGIEVLDKRFAWEIATFKRLGVAPDLGGDEKHTDKVNGTLVPHLGQCDPKQLFVNLLDFSCGIPEHSGEEEGKALDSHNGKPGRAADGRYYTVLELADWSLDKWITQRSTSPAAGRAELYEIAKTLACSLAWLHECNLCHNDVKPANMMRFGTHWKLIDLEGVVPMEGSASIHMSCFTPLYVSPEIARAVLEKLEACGNNGTIPSVLEGVRPSGKIDVWAAGVVLLDVLARGCAFEETYSGFRMQALVTFDDEEDPTGGLKQWYTWLADPAPILPGEYSSPPELYHGQNSDSSLPRSEEEFVKLHALFAGLLAKDPEQRLPTAEFLAHPALAFNNEAAALPPVLSPPKCRNSNSTKRTKKH